MDHDDVGTDEFPAVLHIHWKPILNDYDDECSLLNSDRKIVIGSFTVSEINYILKLKAQTNSIKSKLCGDSNREVSVTLLRSTGIVRGFPLEALNVQGIIFFVHFETHKTLSCKSFRHSFKDGEESFSFEVDVSKVVSESNERHYDVFYIQGHIYIEYPSDTDQMWLANCPAPRVHKLSGDLQCLLEANPFSDITLKCGDVHVQAHRNILASRSPVFKAMLQKTMKESQTGEIEIQDIQPHIVKTMLKYIYCAHIEELSDNSACDLLYAADKYELLDLKEMCVSHLKNAVSNANFIRILAAAVSHDEDLKLVVIDHIGKNFTAIEQSEDWNNLKKQNPDLVMDVLTQIVKFK